VLTFDYRGFGASEGQRWTPWPHEQVRDVRNALSFLAQQAGVDARRLGVVGISMGGGHAISAAAEDERVGAVVAIEPVTSGIRWLRDLRREWEWRVFQERMVQDRARRVTGGESARVSLYEIMVPDPETKVVMDALAKLRPGLETEPQFSLATAEALADYRPELLVDRISPRAVLFIHGAADVLVAPEHSSIAYAFAGDPSRLELVAGMGHTNWQSPKHPIFGQVAELTREWLELHLG
jgi:pimeloyl-ACP methyl ester carboxylesterase